MLKKITALILLMCLMLTSLTGFAATDGYYYYTPGPKTLEFTFENPLALSDAEVSGSSLVLKAQGSAVYDLLLRSNMVTAEISYEAAADVTLTLKTETEENVAALSAEETVKTIDIAWLQGCHELQLSANGNVTVHKIIFTKEQITTARTDVLIVEYDEYDDALQTTVVVKEGAVGIKVNGAMRYIDYENPTVVPENIDGRLYLPIKTAARAFSLYYEDYTDLSYAYMSSENFELYSGANGQYYVMNGQKTDVTDFVVYKNGITWVPVRALAEILGFTVEWKDGCAIIDDRLCVKTIVNSESIMASLKAEFEAFDASKRVTGKTYHVSKAVQASDSNDGSADFPFETINQAALVAQAGDTVIIHEGTYREEVVPQNDGTATSPIIFKAAEGEKVTISAFEEQGGFVPYKNGIYQTIIPKSLGFDRNFIIMNGEVVREGIHPNTDTQPAAVAEFDPEYTGDLMMPVRGDIRVTDKTKLNEAVSANDLNQEEKDYWKGGAYATMYGAGWTYCYGMITGSEKGKIYISDEHQVRSGPFGLNYYTATSGPHENDYGFITNHLNTVDMPGEWYIDHDSCVLYMIPPEGSDPDTLTVEIKQRQRVIDLRDRKYVQFKNIDTIGGGVTMAGDSQMCVINGGTHKYTSHAGISLAADTMTWRIHDRAHRWESVDDAPEFGEAGFMAGGANNAFLNTRIDYSAGAGLYLTGKYHYVENNMISHTGYGGVYCAGITIHSKKFPDDVAKPQGGHTVVNNTSYGSSRAAFYISGESATDVASMLPSGYNDKPDIPYIAFDVAFNHFYDANVTSRDTGVLYTYGVAAGNDWKRSQIHHNVVHDNVTSAQGSVLHTTMYYDGRSSMYDSYSNVLWTKDMGHVTSDTGGGHFIQTGYYLSNTFGWANSPIKEWSGSKEDLTENDFAYGKPFYAGSFQESDSRFMMNYNRLGAKDKIYMSEAVATGNASIDERGFGVLPDEDSAFVFDNAELYENGTWLEVGYTDNRFKFNWDNLESIHVEVMRGGETLDAFNRAIFKQNYYAEDKATEKFLIPAHAAGAAELKLSLRNPDGTAKLAYVRTWPADYAAELEKMAYEPSADVFYFGTYDEHLSGRGTTGIKRSNKEPDVDNGTQLFINNTWDNEYAFYDREFLKDATKFTFRVGTARAYANQIVEFRLDDRSAEPFATLDTETLVEGETYSAYSWRQWTVDFELDESISAGKHTIYVKFVPREKTEVSESSCGTTNSYYMAFYQ